MPRRGRTTGTVAALLLTIAGAGSAVTTPAGAAAAHPAAAHRAAAHPAAIEAPAGDPVAITRYWTPERIRAARPVDTPADKAAGTSAPASAPAGAPAGDGLGEAYTGDLDDPPASTVGKLTFTLSDGTDRWCSASVVNSPARNVIATAGHCVFSEKPTGRWEWRKNFAFIPAYRDKAAPLETWGYERAWTTGEWATGTYPLKFRSDVAMLTLAPNQWGTLIQDVTGGNDIAFETGYERDVKVFGYPEQPEPKYNGERLVVCDERTSKTTGIDMLTIGCDMAEGASGGPWIADLDPDSGTGVLVSVSAASLSGFRGAYFTGGIHDLWETAKGAGTRPAFAPVGGKSGLLTGIQVQNLDQGAPVVAKLDWIGNQGEVVHTFDQEIAAGGAFTVPLNRIPSSFTGGFRATAVTPATGRLNVIANHVDTRRRAVASSAGYAAGSRKLLLPLLMHDNGGVTTWVAVQNVERRPTVVRLRYRDGSGALPSPNQFTIQPGDTVIARQDVAGLPDVLSGTATADGDIVATVFEESAGTLLEYGAPVPSDASPVLAAPLLMAGNYGSLTGIQIQNPGAAPAEATVLYSGNTAQPAAGATQPCSDGLRAARTVTVPAGASVTLLQDGDASSPFHPAEPLLDPQFARCRYIGSATIESTSPMVAVVNQVGPSGSSAYNAVSEGSAGNTVSLPLIQGNNPGSLTGIQVQNLEGFPVSATISYGPNTYTQDVSTPGSKPACTPAGRTFPVPTEGSVTLLLGNNDNAEDWSDRADCTYIGSATVTATGARIVALANQVSLDGSRDQLATYNGG